MKKYSHSTVHDETMKYFDNDVLATDVWMKKYALKDSDDNYYELTPDDMHHRIASELARVEKKYPNPMGEDEIFELLKDFKYVIPAGSNLFGIGNDKYLTSLSNCFYIHHDNNDSYGGIMKLDEELVHLFKRRCVEENSHVMTLNNGLLRIKNITKGDMVLSYNTKTQKSEYKKVIDKFDTFVDKDDRIIIKLSNGSQLKTSKKHPVLTFSEIGEYVYKNAGDIQKGDICISSLTKNNYNVYNFDKKLSDIAWFTGHHLGDGTCGKNKLRFRILGDNEKCIAEYASILNDITGSTAKYGLSKKKGYLVDVWDYTNNKKSLNDVLVRYLDNQRGKKTYSMFTPNFIKNNNLWIPFIAGLIDADGTVTADGRLSLTLTSKTMIDEINSYLLYNGISCHVSVKIDKRNSKWKPLYTLRFHKDVEFYSNILKYLIHDKKRQRLIENKITVHSYKRFITEEEHNEMLNNYSSKGFYKYNRNNKAPKEFNIKRKQLQSAIDTVKGNNGLGISALNILLKHDIINNDKYNEINQRVFVTNVSIDNDSSKYIDIEVDGNHNFYAGNFGGIVTHNCGVGIDVSFLRPKNSKVNNAALTTTGAVSFMNRFSHTTEEVSLLGRRAALMITMDVSHPEIEDFISIKQDLTKVTGANVSIKITDDFMLAVKENNEFELKFQMADKSWIRKKVNAKQIWDKFINASWNSAEPGLLYWDKIKRESPSDGYEGFDLQGVNPCSELTLSDSESCRLTSINLTAFVKNSFTEKSMFDFEQFKNVAIKAQRLMDDITDLEIEKINSILQKIEQDPENADVKFREISLWKKILDKATDGRRSGLGITGLADMLAMLGYTYGTHEATSFSEKIFIDLAKSSYESSINMAKERGAFKNWSIDKDKKSDFINRLLYETIDSDVFELYKKYGRRNIANLTIAPNGSLSLLSKTSSGVEPVFMVKHKRRRRATETDSVDFIDDVGNKWKEYLVFHPKFEEWFNKNNTNKKLKDLTESEIDDIITKSPYYNATAQTIDYIEKIRMQGIINKWIDHSISMTVNLPNNITKKQVSDLYMKGWEYGLKGMTIYRDGSRSGVLVATDSKKEVTPDRPKEIPCDIHYIQANKIKYYVIVGLVNDKPYEIFAFEKKHISIPQIRKDGKLIKVKSGMYNLKYNGTEIENIAQHFQSPQEDGFTRMVSLLLRRGNSVADITEQIDKSYSAISGFYKAISRVLRKNYTSDGKIDEKCPQCNANLVMKEGCKSCPACGFEFCG